GFHQASSASRSRVQKQARWLVDALNQQVNKAVTIEIHWEDRIDINGKVGEQSSMPLPGRLLDQLCRVAKGSVVVVQQYLHGAFGVVGTIGGCDQVLPTVSVEVGHTNASRAPVPAAISRRQRIV